MVIDEIRSLWSQLGVPHKGWTCIDVVDLHDHDGSAGNREFGVCEMCGNERVRFIHIMEHSDFERRIEAGCVCAEKMSEDYLGPRHREAALRNKATRKRNWLIRKWRVSAKGNQFLNVDGHNMGIVPNRFKLGSWSYRIDGEFSRTAYPTQEQAKLALFDKFWELTCLITK